MRVKVTGIFCPLCIFNLGTHMRKYFKKIGLWTVLLSEFTIGYSYAGTWRDLFDGENLNGWERSVKDNRWSATWKTENGLLSVRIEKPEQWHITAADFLQWKAHKLQLNRLEVIGEWIHYDRFAQDVTGELGLFIGKSKPAPDFADGYFFSPEITVKMAFSEKDVYKRGKSKALYHDRFQFTSEHLKVVSDTGKFQLITKNILLTEFFDADIVSIDFIGLIILYRLFMDWSTASISTFSISGQGTSNHNSLDVQLQNTQLTTTWGS